jgi:hypothetical protein
VGDGGRLREKSVREDDINGRNRAKIGQVGNALRRFFRLQASPKRGRTGKTLGELSD